VTERWWRAKGFLCKAFFFVAEAAYSQLFCRLLGKYLLSSKLNNAGIIRRVYFRLQISVYEPYMAVWVLHSSLFMQFLSMASSWTHISQGRAATRLRCGGIFNNHLTANLLLNQLLFVTQCRPIIYHFTANLLLNQPMKEFWKSVKIWRSYRH